MSGADVRLSADNAIARLDRALRHRIDGLREEAARLVDQIRLAAEGRIEFEATMGARQLNEAERIGVVEFQRTITIQHLELTAWGDRLGDIDLVRPLEPGKYRAYVVVVKAP